MYPEGSLIICSNGTAIAELFAKEITEPCLLVAGRNRSIVDRSLVYLVKRHQLEATGGISICS